MMIIAMNIFKRWKPKGKMYSLRCFQCGSAFLSSFNLDAPICGKCIQKAKSLDSSIDNEKICTKCGNRGSEFVIFFVAVFGTTISLYLFFWQASEEAEEDVAKHKIEEIGKGNPDISKKEIKFMRMDIATGMFYS